MASRALLQPVPDQIDLSPVVSGLTLLRTRLAALIGSHDGIDLSLSTKGPVIDLVIHAKVNSDPSRLAFLLETQPLEGIKFLAVEVRADPKAHHRKLVVAKIGDGQTA